MSVLSSTGDCIETRSLTLMSGLVGGGAMVYTAMPYDATQYSTIQRKKRDVELCNKFDCYMELYNTIKLDMELYNTTKGYTL